MVMPIEPRPGTPEGLVAVIQKRIADLQGTNPGAANDLRAFLASGKIPVTTGGKAALDSILRGTPYAANPQTLIEAHNSQMTSVGQPDRRQAGPTDPAYQQPTGSPSSTVAGLGSGAGLASRAVAAAAQAAGGGAPRQSTGPNDPDNPYNTPNGSTGTDPNTQGRGAPSSALASQQAAVAAAQAQTAPPAVANTNSRFTPAQGEVLSKDDDALIRFALRQAGLNPDRLTSFGRTVGRGIVPLLRSARSAYGIANDDSVATMPDFFAQLAKSLTTQGGNFFGQLRELGESTIGSENFKNYLGGISDPEAQAAMLQSLLPIRYAGSNPLLQQSAADTFDRTLNQFKDNIFDNSGVVPNNGIFLDWLSGQQNIDPITRRIFGLR